MSLIASDKGNSDFEITPEGVYHAVCYGVIDLGHQHNKTYDNWGRKIMIQWELPSERIDIEVDGKMVSKPRAISRRFGLSLGTKSHLRPFLESWRGKKFKFDELVGFDLEKLVGVNCMLQVLHNDYQDKTYANVHTVMPIGKGVDKMIPENPTMFYSMDDSGLNYPSELPDWIKKIIMESREYQEAGNPGYEEEQIGGYGEMGDAFPGDKMELPDQNIPF